MHASKFRVLIPFEVKSSFANKPGHRCDVPAPNLTKLAQDYPRLDTDSLMTCKGFIESRGISTGI